MSGDLDGPSGTADAYHVLVTFERTTACIVDGFTIKAGRANGDGTPVLYYVNGINGTAPNYYNHHGGGVSNYKSNPTISNCIITGNIASYYGGGIQNSSSSPAIANCTISNNTADIGGGMYNSGAGPGDNLTVSGCTLSSNTGGGLFNNGSSLTVSSTTVSNNTGSGITSQASSLTVTASNISNNDAGSGGDGGGLSFISSYTKYLTLSNDTFSNNSAYLGGAVSIQQNALGSISGCNFNGNTASGYGGAVYIDGHNGYAVPSISFNNCTFISNSGYQGGGIYNFGAGLSITVSSFSNNTASDSGGGLYNYYGNDAFSITNATFTGNTAVSDGGGVYNQNNNHAISSCTFTGNKSGGKGGGIYTTFYTANIKNCIISGNTSNNSSTPDIFFDGGSITNSLIGPGNNPSPYSFGTGVVTGNPVFVNSSSPAGPDGIFRTADDGLRIGCTSAAKDVGSGTIPTTDILGNPRVGSIDMGAYENSGTGCTNTIQYVDASVSTNGNGYSWNSPKRDLQEAINAVDAGGQVWVKAGTYLPTLDPNGNGAPANLRDKTFYLTTKDVVIYGGFVGTETLVSQRNAAINRTILSGDLDGSTGTNDAYHVFLVNNRTSASVIDGFTITGGRANGNGTFLVSGTSFTQSDGGGIVNNNSSPTISNCIFVSNSATFYAGGLYNISSNPSIITSIFTNNTSGKGAGLLNSNSNPSIISCTFAGNIASSLGGGIYSFGTSGGTITNCILSGNTGGPVNRQNIYKDAGTVLTVSYTVIGDYNSTATNNYTASNIVIGDPFEDVNNPAGADAILGTADDGIRIGCSSPARDAGTGTTPTTDILGNPRVGALDLGAFEFQGTTCSSLIYVDAGRPDNSGTGTSWATAKKDVQAAINEVAAGGSVWVKSGTYLPTLDPNGNATPTDVRDKTFYLTNKDVKLYGGFAGTETVLSQRNAVTNVTTLSGNLDGNAGTNDAYHVIITGTRTTAAVVDGFTITAGRANGNGTVSASGLTLDRSKGAGMYNLNSNPTVGSCIFSGNITLTDGGGMYNKSSSPVITSCTFSNNTAATGAGLYNSAGSPVITSCTFSTNTATTNGGGLLNDNSSPQITGGTFNNNTANTSGGGIYNLNSSPQITRGTFNNNTANTSGSGIYNLNSSPTISTSSFNVNTATVNGGGIYNDGGNATVTNCVLSGNTAGSNGAGMYNTNSSPSISSCTFATNTATQNGGGMYSDINSGGSIINSIVSGNRGGPANRQNIYKDAGTVLTVGYTLIGDYNSTATNNYTASNIVIGDAFVDLNNPAGADAILGTADDGIRIGCSSPARDAGTGTTPTTDILGNPRVGALDLGAFEFQGTTCSSLIYVDAGRPDNSGTGTSWATAKKDVQAAINEVAADGSVWVKSGTYLPTLDPNGNATPTDVRDKTFYLTNKDVKLYGGFAGTETVLSQRNAVTNVTTLSGNLDGNAGTNDAYHVIITGTRTTAAVVDGFTITAGRANGNGTVSASGLTLDRSKGAGMYNLNSNPTVGSCIFSGNITLTDGGGMYNKSSSPVITSCTFSNNTAATGAGLYNSAGSPVITSCTFSTNTATTNGGGLLNDNSSPQITGGTFNNNTANTSGGGIYNLNSSPQITRGTFNNNTANTSGSGIYNLNSSPTISTSSFNVNTATVNGGGIYNDGGNATVTNCVLSGNTAGSNGAGMYNTNSSPSISSCTFATNTATQNGGGIYNIASSPTISTSAFGSNVATQNGGGIYNNSGSPMLINCVFSGNNSGNNGGGIYNESSTPGISSTTFSANTATSISGGIYSDANSGGSVTNTILSGNLGGPANRQNIYKVAGTGVLTVSYSVVADYSTAATNNYTASSVIAGDPLFVDASNAAGPDGIFRTADDGLRIISCVSPARDAGTGTTPAADILGNVRVSVIDIGAYENPANGCPKTLYVDAGKPNNNGVGDSWLNAKKDLQEAINAAAASGDQIWVKAGTYLPTMDPTGRIPPLDPRDKTFYLTTKEVKLYGGFAGTETLLSQRNAVTNVTILSGDLDGPSGTADSYHVLVTGGRTVACVVDGFTITGGRANSASFLTVSSFNFIRNSGGGINNTNSSPTISNCIIRNNSSTAEGGGVFNNVSSPQISSCTFTGNSAGSRGGGLSTTGGNPIVSNCAFISNTALLNGGGAAGAGSTSNISTSNCSFIGNTSNQSGGGLSNGNFSTLSVSNCSFSSNTALNGGGFASINNGIFSMTNCTFSTNNASGNGGGIYNSNTGRGSITNSILRGNTGGPINRQNLYKDTGTTVLTVSNSIIADYNSTAINNYTSGANILSVDPLFVNAANPAGADGKLGTADDGIVLSSCSPAVNAGNITTTPLPQDILNNNRVGGYDMGAYEYQLAATLPVLASTNTTDARTAYLGEATSFGDCSNTIATLRSQGSAPVSGMVTTKIYIQSTVLMQGQIPYVRRYYDITPTANANTGTAQVSLYFTQADFDNYNSSRGNNLPLPSDGADVAGNKANIQIMQEHGTSSTGLPGSYTGWGGAGPAQVIIIPLSVIWNVQILRWEVTFPVTGFSGFFLQTVSGGALPPPTPAITASAVTGSIATCSGAASTSTESFTVSGSNLSSALTLNAPSNFEISTSSTSGFATSLSFTPTSGSVASTTIYVRSAANASTGSISGNVTASSGTASQTVGVSGTVNENPSATLGTINSVSSGTTSFSMPYSSATGFPDSYSVSSTAPNPMSNFSAVPTSTLNASPISVAIPSSAAAGTYNFNLVLSNSSTTCSSTIPFTLQVTTAPPTITTGTVAGSIATCSGAASTSTQSFTISGSNLTAAINLSAPANFEISTSSTSGFATSLSFTPTSGSVASTTIYVRSAANASTGSISGNVTASSGTASQTVGVSGTVNENPSATLGTINTVTSGTTSFSIPYSSTTGFPDSYSVSSTVPNPMSNFSAVPTSTLNASPISVAIPSSAAAGTYNFNLVLSNSSTTCSSTIPFTLQVTTAPPTITTGTVTGSIATCSGAASSNTQSFTISGSNLTAAINLNAPANFEISTSAASGFANSLSLTPASGSVASTTIYVRSAANASTGSISGNVTASSGTATQTIGVSGTVNENPSATLGTINSVSSGTTSFSIPYSSATGSPDSYNVSGSSPNPMSNFNNVNGASITSSPIYVAIPNTAPSGTYNFTLTLINSSTGCQSVNPISLQVLSNNANLSSLTLNNGATLSPTFASGTINYTSSVPYSVSSITVTPTTADQNAHLDVNSNALPSGSTSAPINLNVGLNQLYVHVLAQDNTTGKTYQVSVTRQAQQTPVFSSFSPTSAGNGATVTITGSNLDNVSGVSFAGVAASSFTVVSSTQITAVVPHTTSGSVVINDATGTYSQPGFIYLSALPLSFVNAKAFKENGNVLIQWQVADASDSRLFTIQRSENGSVFTDLGTVIPSLKAQYDFVDTKPLKTNGYYRIKSTSVSGQVIYSEVVLIENNTKQQITIFPNPVHGNKFSVHLSGGAGIYKITIVNLLGNQVYSTELNHNGLESTYPVTLQNVLAKGVYHVQVTLPDHSVQSKQIIIADAE